MRRLVLCMALAGLLGMAVGCHCTCGVCDCDPTGPCGTYGSCQQCGYHDVSPDGPPAPAGAPAPLPTGPIGSPMPVGQ